MDNLLVVDPMNLFVKEEQKQDFLKEMETLRSLFLDLYRSEKNSRRCFYDLENLFLIWKEDLNKFLEIEYLLGLREYHERLNALADNKKLLAYLIKFLEIKIRYVLSAVL